MRHATAGGSLLFVISALFAGCSVIDSDGEGEPPLGQIPTVRSAVDIVLPLDAYFPDPDDRLGEYRAFHMLGRDCMARFGLDWNPPSDPGPQPTIEELNWGRYGLFDPDVAAGYGYRHTPFGAPQNEVERSSEAWNPTEAHLLVWSGGAGQDIGGSTPTESTSGSAPLVNGVEVPPGGCEGEVEQRLADGARQADLGLPDRLRLESYAQAENDRRVQALFDQWADCMRAKGYDYDGPWQANDAEWPADLTDQEINTAVADVGCRQDLRLVETWMAVEIAYQERAIDAHAQELALVRELTDARIRNVARVLAGG